MGTHNICFVSETGRIHCCFNCVEVKRHVNPCGSFRFVSHRKGEKRRDSTGDERDRREERGTGNKWRNRRNKNISYTLTCYKDSRPCPTVSQYQLDAPVTQDTRTFATPDSLLEFVIANRVFRWNNNRMANSADPDETLRAIPSVSTLFAKGIFVDQHGWKS